MNRLFDRLEEFGESLAIVDESEREISYAALLQMADEYATGLGSQPQLVFVEIANALPPIAAYIGALRAGHAVVLTGEGGGAPGARLAETFPPNFVFSHSADGWQFQKRCEDNVALHPDLAVLLSTSGSTGSPKLVRLSHGALIANAHSIAEYLDYRPGERAITSLPPAYSYGMSVINSHLLTGATLILSDHSVADDAFWSRARKHGATSFAGVPHSYELLEHRGFLQSDLPALRYFTQAGGRLAPEKIRLFADWANERGKRLYVMYGQTEAGPRMAYVPPELIAEQPDIIGCAIPGGELRIEPLPSSESAEAGELIYRGPNVMMGYAQHPEDLALGSQLTELRTGDLATRDDRGLFRIVGRASRFLKIFGLRIGLDEVEHMLRERGLDAVATGDDEGLVVATTSAGRESETRQMLAGKLKLPPSRIAVFRVGAIPRQSSGKIDYPAILRLRLANTPPVTADFRVQMAEILGVDAVGDTDTFVGLGGDSLSYVQASLLIEGEFGSAPDDWENTPFGRLAQIAPAKPERTSSLECSVFVRAIAIMLVVFKHTSNWNFGGAATSLLIIAGMNFSRFQLPQLNNGSSGQLLKTTALRVGVPYMVMITIYFIAVGQIFLPQYFLYANFTDGFIYEGQRRFLVYWFVEIYLTLIAILCLLYLSPRVRNYSKAHPKVVAVGIFALTSGLALIAKPLNHIPLFHDHTLLSFSYVFAFGWMIDRLKTTVEKVALIAVGAITLYVLPTDHVLTAVPVVVVAALMLLFIKRVPVGALLAKPLSVIASASLYIYIFHGLILHPTRVVLGGEDAVPPWTFPILFVVAILFGVGLWQAVQLLSSKNLRQLLVQMRPRRRALRDA